MINTDTIADDIFKILKGSGQVVKLFTDEGENTVDQSKARRFYMPASGSMVNLDETDSKRELRVSINRNTQLDEIKDIGNKRMCIEEKETNQFLGYEIFGVKKQHYKLNEYKQLKTKIEIKKNFRY